MFKSGTNPLAELLLPPPRTTTSGDVPGYTPWLKQVTPEFSWDWPHLVYIRKQLADVTRGHCRKLILSMPPQFGKSEGLTVRYPIWRMERKQSLRVAVGAYNQTHANRFSRKSRRIARTRFPLSGERKAANEWETEGGGSYVAVGVGAGITGLPVDCLPGESMVMTQRGLVRIDSIVTMESKPKVLSYNHGTGAMEYRQVVAVQTTYADKLVELVTRSGRVIRCTGNHRVFTIESGYRTADGIRPGMHLSVFEGPEGGQSAREPRRAMQDVPRHSPQVVADSVAMVRRVCVERQPVYDLQVEGNSNFFANGVLVHNCLIIDDPVKNREEADSEAHRERVWEWYMDDLTTRLQEGAPIILVMTRWHEADLAGKILASDDGPNWRHVRLPAIAEENDPLGRAVGAPLCPERFSLETLEERRKILGEGFEGLYQQNPVPRGGLFFKREWFKDHDAIAVPDGHKMRRVRYWDLAAATKDTSCYTAGVLMNVTGPKGEERYYVEHVVRERLGPADRNELILKTAQQDAHLPGFERTWFEEQPGAAGVETSAALIRKLAGLPCRADRVTGSKEVRAEPLADAARGGLIYYVRGGWNAGWLNELASFPRGAYADQVDSTSGGFNKLARGGLYWAA